jgi:hypothetical protein
MVELGLIVILVGGRGILPPSSLSHPGVMIRMINEMSKAVITKGEDFIIGSG